MANCALLTKLPQSKLLARALIWLLWAIFLTGNLILVAMLILLTANPLTELIVTLFLLFLLLNEVTLLACYAPQVGQWRIIILFWIGYSLARLVATLISNPEAGLEVELVMLIAIYMMIGAWFSMFILTIRRDVSLVFLMILAIVGPVFIRAQLLAAGGAMAFIHDLATPAEFEAFTIAEPMMMALACMTVLVMPTLVFHLLKLLVKEVCRAPLSGS